MRMILTRDDEAGSLVVAFPEHNAPMGECAAYLHDRDYAGKRTHDRRESIQIDISAETGVTIPFEMAAALDIILTRKIER